jgi:uncharacterized membrane protein
MNPWNIRSALLAKHAQHVMLIHFPIALFLTGVLFDLAASLMPASLPPQPGPVDPRTAIPEGLPLTLAVATPVALPAMAGKPTATSPNPVTSGRQPYRRDLAVVSFWNFTLAAASAIPAAITGLLAWQWELDGRHLKGILLLHLLAGSASLLLIASVWFIHEQARSHQTKLSNLRWPLEIFAALVVAFTGHLGGFLSGVNHP